MARCILKLFYPYSWVRMKTSPSWNLQFEPMRDFFQLFPGNTRSDKKYFPQLIAGTNWNTTVCRRLPFVPRPIYPRFLVFLKLFMAHCIALLVGIDVNLYPLVRPRHVFCLQRLSDSRSYRKRPIEPIISAQLSTRRADGKKALLVIWQLEKYNWCC